MSTITISKKEYEQLSDTKLRYEYLRAVLETDLFSAPPTRSKEKVVAAMRATGKYSRRFLESIQRGLGRSSHFK
jgi:DNA polymerase III delta prime subunit